MQNRALVLAGEGINCENETHAVLTKVGFVAEIMTIQSLMQRPDSLSHFQLLVFPGGFSYGDELGSGRVMALKMKQTLSQQFNEFVAAKKLVLGICNGFQILTQLGLLPFSEHGKATVTLAKNSGGQFINRWVELKIKCPKDHPASKIWFNQFNLNNCTDWWLPIRHGEGRIVVKDEMIQKKINDQQLGVLTYLENVNGSYQQIAGLCNLTGNVLGLMPHPEAGAYPAQLPFPGLQARGLWLFESALSYLKSEM